MTPGSITGRPLPCKALFLKGQEEPLRDCVVCFAGSFVIVAKDNTDTAPTWYNVERVEKLEGVEDPEAKRQQRVGFF